MTRPKKAKVGAAYIVDIQGVNVPVRVESKGKGNDWICRTIASGNRVRVSGTAFLWRLLGE